MVCVVAFALATITMGEEGGGEGLLSILLLIYTFIHTNRGEDIYIDTMKPKRWRHLGLYLHMVTSPICAFKGFERNFCYKLVLLLLLVGQ